MTSLFGTPRQVANGWVHPDAPPQPVLSLCADDGSLCVTITPIPGATEYSVYLGEAPGAEDTSPIVTTSASKFSIPGLTNGTTYYAYATAVVEGVESMRSLEQSAAPFALVQPSLAVSEADDGTTTIEWAAQSGASYVLSDGDTPVWGGPGYDGTMRVGVDVSFTSANGFTIMASTDCTCMSSPPPPPPPPPYITQLNDLGAECIWLFDEMGPSVANNTGSAGPSFNLEYQDDPGTAHQVFSQPSLGSGFADFSFANALWLNNGSPGSAVGGRFATMSAPATAGFWFKMPDVSAFDFGGQFPFTPTFMMSQGNLAIGVPGFLSGDQRTLHVYSIATFPYRMVQATSTTLVDESTYFFVVSVDGSGNWVLYVNGVSVASGTESDFLPFANWGIGFGSAAFFPGLVLTALSGAYAGCDEAFYISRVLTPTEIANLYSAGV